MAPELFDQLRPTNGDVKGKKGVKQEKKKKNGRKKFENRSS